MLIEITGARFTNKGAQLMLATVCQRLREAVPDVRLSMPMTFDGFEERAIYGLNFTLRRPERWTNPRRLARDVLAHITGRTPLRRAFGLVSKHEIDGLIDISGYAFGDKWPLAVTRQLAQRALTLKRRGRPVVMLPQMLGPFTKPGQAGAFRELAQHVDRIYAREQESFECARPLVDEHKLRLAPDITIPTPARPVPTTALPYACIVPNSKLLEHNPQRQNWGDSYLPRLVAVSRHLARHGLLIRIVQHEYANRDARLVDELAANIGDEQCEVVRHFDPQVLKGILGGAELVVGSRFHALVSTLSMGVPAIALGWAHKYDALLRDFGVAELIHYANSPLEHLFELVDDVFSRRPAITQVLKGNKIILAAKVEQLWTDVLRLFPVSLDQAKAGDDAQVFGESASGTDLILAQATRRENEG